MPSFNHVLAQEILPHINGSPCFLLLEDWRVKQSFLFGNGASGCQLGTDLFVQTECQAHPNI